MGSKQFEDEFTVHVISSASMEIFDQNTLASFRNFFNDEIKLSGDWRVALSEIIFPTKISGFEFISQLENCLLVFDDSCEQIFNDKEFSKLATAGRYRNISVIYVKHNIFQQSKWSRTIDLNTTHIILFKSPRDIQQITYVGKQLNDTNFLKESYELATKQRLDTYSLT